MFDIRDFKPITMADKPIFDAHYAKYPPNHSENIFTTLVSWKHFVQPFYLVNGGNLIIMTRIDSQPRFRAPSGPRNIGAVKRIMEIARGSGTDYYMVLVENDMRDWLSANLEGVDFISHRDYFDYVYLASDLARLSGKKYLKIRNKLNRFRRQYEYETEILCHENMDEIREFLNRWCLWRDCESDELLEQERLAIIYTMENCFELGLSGLAIRINGEIQAVSVFESMNTETAVIHFEKAMPDFDGLYQAINQETARHLADHNKFINRQSDLGIEGLRTAKQRYHPHHMVEVQHMVPCCDIVEEKEPEYY